MSETKEAAIFDPEAHIEAIAIRFDEGSETWQLQSVGTLEECRQSCLRARSKGCEEQMRVLPVGHGGMHFNGETDKVVIGPDGHGTIESSDADDAARYRWLRQRQPQTLACICWGHSSKACRISQGEGETRNDYIDRTLDAAMGSQCEWVAPMPQPDVYQDGDGVVRNET